MPRNNAFRTTKIPVTALNLQEDDQHSLEMAFIDVEMAKTSATTLARQAAIAQAEAVIALQQAQISSIRLLIKAAEHSPIIAAEQMWMVYKDSSGVLTFEGVTERLLRNNFRAQQDMIGRQAQDLRDIDDTGLYEDGNEETSE